MLVVELSQQSHTDHAVPQEKYSGTYYSLPSPDVKINKTTN